MEGNENKVIIRLIIQSTTDWIQWINYNLKIKKHSEGVFKAHFFSHHPGRQNIEYGKRLMIILFFNILC